MNNRLKDSLLYTLELLVGFICLVLAVGVIMSGIYCCGAGQQWLRGILLLLCGLGIISVIFGYIHYKDY